MTTGPLSDRELLDKIRSLPPAKMAEVEDFVELLLHRDTDRALARAASSRSNDAFRKAWNNPDDADYDLL